MKTLIFFLTGLLLCGSLFAQDGIRWLSIDEAVNMQKVQPKKVLIFVYTGWCHNCQNMESTTLTNPDIAAYINQHYYAVRFDADSKEPVRFYGRYYIHPNPADAQAKHQFAVALAAKDGTIGFPAYVYFDEDFRRITTPIRGYKDVSALELDLKFIAGGHYKKTSLEAFGKSFVSTFDPVVSKSFNY